MKVKLTDAIPMDRPEPDTTVYTFPLGSDLKFVPCPWDRIESVMEYAGKITIVLRKGKPPETDAPL